MGKMSIVIGLAVLWIGIAVQAETKPLDYQNKRALGFFTKDYNRYLPEFETITPDKIQKLNGYIERLENRFSKLTARDHPDVIAAGKKLADLKAKLQGKTKGTPSPESVQSDQKNHQAFQKLYQQNRVALDVLSPADLAKPAEAKHWKKTLSQFAEIVKNFKNKENPHVKKDLQLYAKIKAKIESGLAGSGKVDIKSYPKFEQDKDFLNALYKKYSENKIFARGNENIAKQLLADYDNDSKAYNQLKKKYAAFIEGNKTASAPAYKQATDLKRNLRNAGEWMDKFKKAKQEFVTQAGPNLETLMTKTRDKVAQAVKEKRPQWFTGGGISHAMIQIRGQLDSLAAIKGKNDPQVKTLEGKFAGLNNQVKKAESDLKESILASTPMPADAYTGGDKNAIINQAVKAWNRKHADKPILARGISMPRWQRRTEWRYKSVDGTRYKVDRSYLQVWVIVKTGDTLATQYFIELDKNHLQGDGITINVPSNLQGDVFKTEMLLKNVR